MTTKLKLKVSGMHCTSCAMNIDGELEDLGVKNANTNYAKGETTVEFDPKAVKIEQIKNTIAGLGYSSVIDDSVT